MQESILNVSVSRFKNYNTPANPQPVKLLHWLTSQKHAATVNAIRLEKDKSVRDAIKATLPAITPSGLFSHRSTRCLTAHSGFIQFDIDFKENNDIANYSDLKKEVCKIVNVAYCGLSVSGTGFWGLIPIAYPEKHRQHFEFIYNAFNELGITIDKKPGNVAALRGYSYDPEAYFNHSAITLQEYHQPPLKPGKCTAYSNSGHSTQAQVEALINQISKRGIDITSTYSEWLNVGFALSNEFGEAGRQYFHDVSQNFSGYDRSETDNQYNKCINAAASSKPVTIKTFLAKCKDAGIVLPKPERKTVAKTERFKTKSRQEHSVIQIFSNNVICMLGETHTGQAYDNLIIAGIGTGNGNVYDLLFDARGELVKPGKQVDTVSGLATVFEKKFIHAKFDNTPCWAHIHSH